MSRGFNFKGKVTPTASKPAATPAKPPKPAQSVFDQLADSAYVRAGQLVQSSANPASTAPLPFSEPTLWRKVKAGTFPAPIKLSARVTGWQVADIRQWMQAQAAQGYTPDAHKQFARPAA